MGYSATGLPLYSYAEDKIQQTTHELIPVLRSGMKHILEDDNSRSIFYFLLLNLVSNMQLLCKKITYQSYRMLPAINNVSDT